MPRPREKMFDFLRAGHFTTIRPRREENGATDLAKKLDAPVWAVNGLSFFSRRQGRHCLFAYKNSASAQWLFTIQDLTPRALCLFAPKPPPLLNGYSLFKI